MTLEQLLTELDSRRIQIRKRGAELVLRGKQEQIEPELVRALRAHKDELLRTAPSEDERQFEAVLTPEMLTRVARHELAASSRRPAAFSA